MKLLITLCILLIYTSCSKVEETTSENSGETEDTQSTYSLSLEMQRVDQAGLDPFDVTITLKKDDTNLSGQTLSLSIPKGVVSTITDNLDGTYTFRVTPSATGEYPVTVSFDNASISRTAIVLDSNIAGSGQPMMVPGDYVNTEGYEDGATITLSAPSFATAFPAISTELAKLLIQIFLPLITPIDNVCESLIAFNALSNC